MKNITVFGHSYLYYDKEELEKIAKLIIEKIENENFTGIYIGGYGRFDSSVARKVKDIKKEYANFKSSLVLAYPNPKWDKYDISLINETYDENFMPDFGSVPAKFAILKRNEWMIDNSDFIIFHIDFTMGGAYKAYQYAKRKKKNFVNLGSVKKSHNNVRFIPN